MLTQAFSDRVLSFSSMDHERRRFLTGLSLAGVTALAGCSGADTDGSGPSTATRTNSATTSGGKYRLAAPGDASNSRFGSAIDTAADGRTAIVGAPDRNTRHGKTSGAAYLFRRSDEGWTRQEALVRDNGSKYDLFGHSVSISGDGTTVAVGAVSEDNRNGRGAGSVYVFRKSDGAWTQRAKLTADEGSANADFGCAVSVSDDGTTIAIGARYAVDSENRQMGTAYVFTEADDDWVQRTTLRADETAPGAAFGSSVAMSGDGSVVVAGARSAGSASAFSGSGENWRQEASWSPDGGSGAEFGRSVAVSGDGSTAIVGAYLADGPDSGSEIGTAYVFTRDGGAWSRQIELTADDPAKYDMLGTAVSISEAGSTAIVGTPRDDTDGGRNAGSAYVFTDSGSRWDQQTILTASVESSANLGRTVSVSDDGSTAVAGVGNRELAFSFDLA